MRGLPDVSGWRTRRFEADIAIAPSSVGFADTFSRKGRRNLRR